MYLKRRITSAQGQFKRFESRKQKQTMKSEHYTWPQLSTHAQISKLAIYFHLHNYSNNNYRNY